MRAAITAGDGARYAAIRQRVAAARGEISTPVVHQQTWPMVSDVEQAELAGYALCSTGQRCGAWLIDWGAYYVAWLVAVVITAAIPFIGVFLVLAVIGAAVVNQYAMGHTGQSLGKKALGIYLINETTHQPMGGWQGIGRWLLHILDWLPLGIGMIVGLATGQTFADRIMGTIVVAKPRGTGAIGGRPISLAQTHGWAPPPPGYYPPAATQGHTYEQQQPCEEPQTNEHVQRLPWPEQPPG